MMDYLSGFFNLKGKTAAIIGGGGYLLSEMARGLAKAGVNAAVFDKNAENACKVAEEIAKAGGNAIGGGIDVVSKASHEAALDAVLGRFGNVDILINGAGINAPTPFFDISLDEWHAIIVTHVTGTMLGCQVFGKHMVERKKGSIINMSSVSAGPALSKAFSYSVAKAGIRNLTQNLGREWAPCNVRVNCLRPGFFPTEWSKKHFIDKARNDAILNHTPMKRYGKPEELVGAVLWLASDAASFVTGAQITIDGGFTAMTI
jgi:NAD(P)-dependent dehydrogenase (short-subunit alcohol dehydrogenase family)